MKNTLRTAWMITLLAALLSACGTTSDEGAIEASGFLEARVYRVVSLAQGRVISVLVTAGDEILRDEILIELDLASLEAGHQAAAAMLAHAEAELEGLERAPTEAEEAQLVAQLEAAQIGLHEAEAALELLEDAYEPGQPPERRLVPAQTAVDAAQAAVDVAQASLDQARAGTRIEELRAAQAAVDEAQANLEMAALSLELARGASPVDGVVQQIGLRTHEVAAPGSLIATIADTRQLSIIVYLDQEQVARIDHGDEVEVRADAYPNEVYEGHVSWIAEEAQFTPTTVQTEEERVSLVFAVRIEVVNTSGRLIAGLPADIIIWP